MRVLWCLIVACLVAATGVRPSDAHRALRPDVIERATQSAARTVASRPRLHTIGERRWHGPDLQSSPVALGASLQVRTPPPRALTLASAARADIFPAIVLTRFARGPPAA